MCLEDDESKELCYTMRKFWNGDLHSKIQESKLTGCNIDWEEIWEMLYQVTKALSNAHSKNVCHWDIKPHNITWDFNMEYSLIDFGVSKTLKQTDFK